MHPSPSLHAPPYTPLHTSAHFCTNLYIPPCILLHPSMYYPHNSIHPSVQLCTPPFIPLHTYIYTGLHAPLYPSHTSMHYYTHLCIHALLCIPLHNSAHPSIGLCAPPCTYPCTPMHESHWLKALMTANQIIGIEQSN